MEIQDFIRILLSVIILIIAFFFLYKFLQVIGNPGTLTCKFGYAMASVFVLYDPFDLLTDNTFVYAIHIVKAYLEKLLIKKLGYDPSLMLSRIETYVFFTIKRSIKEYKRTRYNAVEKTPIFALYRLFVETPKKIITTFCKTKTLVFNTSEPINCKYIKDRLKDNVYKDFEKRFGKCQNNIHWKKVYFHLKLLEAVINTLGETGLAKTGIDYPHYVIFVTDGSNIKLTERDLACLWYLYKNNKIAKKYGYRDYYTYDTYVNEYCKYITVEKSETDPIVSNKEFIIEDGKNLISIIYMGDGNVLLVSKKLD